MALEAANWAVDSWKAKLAAQQTVYEDREAVEAAVGKLRDLPPLVTSWEIERLKAHLAEAQRGERFLLQGGDCAETLADCRPDVIANKLKILLQMSLVLVHGSHRPVIRVGRFAGQYAKPRSSMVEQGKGPTGETIELPSYFGDLVNEPAFTAQARRPDPHRMVRGYEHAALTLNFIRALVEGGFADLHHPEYWDLGFLQHASLSPQLREQHQQITERLASALRFMEALGETSVDKLLRVEFFTSHEGLNLLYESAQTRRVPRREGHFDLTTHLPWIGERTRQIEGAHIEFFRGIRNPIGVKIGPDAAPEDVVRLAETLNPDDRPGKIVLIHRMGASRVAERLGPIIDGFKRSGRTALWVCDPMHGNGVVTASGLKTRCFDDILREVETSFDTHHACGTLLGGVHFELTGEDVTECLGGASGVTEADLDRNYTSRCDPRLNYQQSLELALCIARRMSDDRRQLNGA